VSERHTALLIDEKAVGTDQSQKFVLTLTSTNTVEYRAVGLGSLINGMRVVQTGLQAGDEVVVNGLQRVRPGSPVTAERTAPQSTQTALR
jgi:multidrug efflux pump subunit AcrA (membrane-fusion protein)